MQVSAVADHITHAVIGGNKAIQFQVSQEAEFFHLLSSTLYSDQILAVVRETLCNAWDAHIAAGRTDTAIKVTLLRDKLIIRDFGLGIPKDKMGEVYGTYGNSTKKNDGQQTGGFGLGCKSPYAYTDHFQVTIWNQGIKTIYAMSKSSAELEGKPAIMPIASFPTDESGLEVMVPIKFDDYGRFNNLIKRIAFNGSMQMALNAEPVEPGLPMGMDHNFLITTHQPLDKLHKICLRYGNVVYPVEGHPVLAEMYSEVKGFIEKLATVSPLTIIFQAPGHSISVTPSRESLSMQDKTVATLKKMFEEFLPLTREPLAKECFHFLDQRIEEVKKAKRIGELLNSAARLPMPKENPDWGVRRGLSNISTLSQLADQHMRVAYPSIRLFRQTDIDKRIAAALELGIGKKGHLQQLRRLVKGPSAKTQKAQKSKSQIWHYGEGQEATDWYLHRIVRPLVRDLQNAGKPFDYKRMYVRCGSKSTVQQNYMLSLGKVTFNSFVEILPLLRNIVILTHGKRDMEDNARHYPDWDTLGSMENSFVYVHPYGAKKHLPEVRQFFTKRGFTLIDLTDDLEWTPAKPAPVVSVEPMSKEAVQAAKERRAGYPALIGARTKNGITRIDSVLQDGKPRIVKPEFYYLFTPSKSYGRDWQLGLFDAVCSDIILDLWGEKTAAIYTSPQVRRLAEQNGTPELLQHVIQYVVTQVTTAPQFLKYWPEAIELGISSEVRNGEIVLRTLDRPEIRKALGLKTVLKGEDRLILQLYRFMARDWRFDQKGTPFYEERKAAKEMISKIQITPRTKEISARIKGNSLLEALDLRYIDYVLREYIGTPKDCSAKVALIIKGVLGD